MGPKQKVRPFATDNTRVSQPRGTKILVCGGVLQCLQTLRQVIDGLLLLLQTIVKLLDVDVRLLELVEHAGGLFKDADPGSAVFRGSDRWQILRCTFRIVALLSIAAEMALSRVLR